ncbi:Imm51 family immunity protein [Cohnella ginsengisoli]|uniref:Imm51 family immunity protein n=1 Tax=Cohnella ginsengisoli TaxID=425004 RepID=A0A9X4KLH4_9BACL|nr:Imm51 family immunity protein [Cohnella ginsengisoli]MDG0791850.1 Imm51 family immunity protein [Cohnella ginsengisoli]
MAKQGVADALWHFRTGYSYYYLDRYEEAIAAFEQAIRLDPSDELARKLLRLSRTEAERLLAKPMPTRVFSGVPFEPLDFSCFWEDSDYAREAFVSDPPTDELIAEVEEELGYKLPASYIHLMKLQNGGIPRNTCFPTKEATSWADDHIAITGIMGIGKDKDYSLCGAFGSPFMIEEWGYPDIGVVFCDCPSAGHDVVMLDYRGCGPQGEPQVVHVDQERDYRITFLASNFEDFIRGLVNEDTYDTSEADTEQDLLRVPAGQFTTSLAELGGHETEIETELAPFKLVRHGDSTSVFLSAGIYKQDLFRLREEEGFEGSGYDWASLAAVFLEERMPELSGIVRFDPEAGMFSAYSGDREAIVRFAHAFKSACEDDVLIRDLFSRAELD